MSEPSVKTQIYDVNAATGQDKEKQSDDDDDKSTKAKLAKEKREELRRAEIEKIRAQHKQRLAQLQADYDRRRLDLERHIETNLVELQLESELADLKVKSVKDEDFDVEDVLNDNPSPSEKHLKTQEWVKSQNNNIDLNANAASFIPRQTSDTSVNLMLKLNLLQAIEPSKFSGNPADYPTFRERLNANLEDGLLDNSQKVEFLPKFLTGEAKEVFERVKASGYDQIIKTLETRYGHPANVAAAVIRDLTLGPKLANNDYKGLLKFSEELDSKSQVLTGEYEVEGSTSTNLNSIVARLPNYISNKWYEKCYSIRQDRNPKLKDLSELVTKQALIKNDPCMSFHMNPASTNTSSVNKPKANKHTTSLATDIKKDFRICVLCNNPHGIWSCQEFAKMTLNERWDFVKMNKLCHCCLNKGHQHSSCSFKTFCGCNSEKKHHKLLHNDLQSREKFKKSTGTDTPVDPVAQYSTNIDLREKTILLHVCAVKVLSPEGRSVTTYGLMDNASRATIMSPKLKDRLNLKGESEDISVKTVIGVKTQKLTKVDINLKCAYGKGKLFPVKGLISTEFDISEKIMPHDIDLDKHFSSRVKLFDVELKEISILIGKDVEGIFEVFEVEKSKSDTCSLEAQRGHLGWVITGSIYNSKPDMHSFNHLDVNFLTCDLTSAVENFWKIESSGSNLNSGSLSVQDKRALDILESTTKIDPATGHYETGLLWAKDDTVLPDNRFEAENRLKTLLRKFQKNEEYKQLYTQTLNDYIAKGYARKLSDDEKSKKNATTWYLPHFGVVNDNKPGKVRIVFDAAASLSGTSLNRNLLSGPDQTNNLLAILLKFRQDNVALTADIEGMFHQVRVKAQDQDSLRFLWSSDNGEPDEYVFVVHIFGATDSPCASNFCLRKTALDNRHIFSEETVNCILQNFYVDDLLKSFPTPAKAIQISEELINLCAKGGFKLTKFLSNDKNVLKSIPADKVVGTELFDLDLNGPSSRALGIGWNVRNDKFGFKVDKIKQETSNTMRGALSMLCRIFDPLGMAAPFVFRGKQIIQELWRRHIKWDDPLPDDILSMWSKWKLDIDILTNISVPRCYFSKQPCDCVIEMHNFCDASEQGYAAVSYLRIVYPNSDIEVSFVIGKSRNAPLKTLTIPRLELQGAVLAVRMDKILKDELEISIDRTLFWTDSMITLNYINNQTRRFKSYIANRVSEICETTSPDQWKHISGKLNPADECTRSNSLYSFADGLWLKGPSFLMEPEGNWPHCEVTPLPTESLEVKKEVKLNYIDADSKLYDLVNRYSDFYTLLRAVVWLLKFLDWIILPKERRREIKSNISLGEINVAKTRVISLEQERVYAEEIQTLKTDSVVKVTSHIVKLKPILKNGLLCVGGRIGNAPISEQAIHPIILPQKSNLTDILIRHTHVQNGHCGNEQVLTILREQYWIVKGRSSIRTVLGSCITCRKLLAQPLTQEMSELPKTRLIPYETPFTYCGVDYFGPLLVKRGRGRVNEKRWGVIFVCFNSRAIHLELAKSLETDDFLLVLIRFLNRRGYVKEIRSDNGSNFIGAEREIKEALDKLDKKKLERTLGKRECKWIFQIPTASHMSGVWERLVKTVKRSLKTVLGNEPYNEEILITLFSDAERIANSRPLTRNPSDPTDFNVLTPNHFLNIRPTTLIPPEIVDERDKFSRKRWKQVQLLSDHYWKRWLQEYLPSLQMRQKWHQPKRNLCKNDLVLVIDDNMTRNNWSLGLVIDTYPGPDGLVRSVNVKTKRGMFKRPISKLCLLEASDSDI